MRRCVGSLSVGVSYIGALTETREGLFGARRLTLFGGRCSFAATYFARLAGSYNPFRSQAFPALFCYTPPF